MALDNGTADRKTDSHSVAFCCKEGLEKPFHPLRIEADTGIRPSFALEAFGDLDADVRQSIARIKASPFIPNKDSIRGFVYEVETGRLREVKE